MSIDDELEDQDNKWMKPAKVKATYHLKCKKCGSDFTAHKFNAKYCSALCRTHACYDRRAAAGLPRRYMNCRTQEQRAEIAALRIQRIAEDLGVEFILKVLEEAYKDD